MIITQWNARGKSYQIEGKKILHLDRIQSIVEDTTGVQANTKSQEYESVITKRIYIWLARINTPFNNSHICRTIGLTHATGIYHHRMMQAMIETNDKAYMIYLERIFERVNWKLVKK